MTDSTTDLPSFGGSLALSFVALGVVCLLAYFGLRLFGRRLVGKPGAMRVVSRLSIEPRRSLVVVDVAGRGFLLGSSEAGVSMLAELEMGTFERVKAEAARGGTVADLPTLPDGGG